MIIRSLYFSTPFHILHVTMRSLTSGLGVSTNGCGAGTSGPRAAYGTGTGARNTWGYGRGLVHILGIAFLIAFTTFPTMRFVEGKQGIGVCYMEERKEARKLLLD